jgi:S-adenosylmethionine-diacylgycerolhomoserine-N-methlytransferase
VTSAAKETHADLMDGVYRRQRHFYDLTRKYYLLGRDRLLDGLAPPPGGNVLELGCGTGRNLIQAARIFPQADFCGLDISAEMLATASAAVARKGISARVRLAQGDASDFDTEALFGRAGFDRVFISYALSMIPPWRETVTAALDTVAERGSLHIVDFGSQERLPLFFRSGLRAWLAKFHVAPRDDLRAVLEAECQRTGARLEFDSLYGGYAVHAVLTRR